MAKPAETSRRSARIDSIRGKLEASKKVAASAEVAKPAAPVTASSAFTSLNHLLNATALYSMGEYDRATAAFQRAMASEDAPAMLESLENAQLEDTSEETLEGTDTTASEDVAPAVDSNDTVQCDDASDNDEDDYLSEDFDMGDDSELDAMADDLDLDEGSDADEDDIDDLLFEDDPEETAKKTNLAAIAAVKKISLKR